MNTVSPYLVAGVLAAYFALLFGISVITSRKSDSLTFFTANRQSPWYLVAFGMIGASLSGVTFISVPGWVGNSGFTYYQMVLGYLLGYIVVAKILLPLYYKHNLVTIYTWLDGRFGRRSYKTGAWLFLVSRTIGSAFRLFIVAAVLHMGLFAHFNVPFWITVVVTLLLIYLYTFKGGIKTIVFTDALQTLFLLLSVVVFIVIIAQQLDLSATGIVQRLADSEYTHTFEFDWQSGRNFFKQFLAGAFITIVMTGLDQDMMQKNLTCRSLRDAQKNMYWYGTSFLVVNIFFLALGALLFIYIGEKQLVFSDPNYFMYSAQDHKFINTDFLFPQLAFNYFGSFAALTFLLGIVAAAYSSADSALTALTTSFVIDILNRKPESTPKKLRYGVHISFSILIAVIILIFKSINNSNVISSLFTMAGYTYGPLLGLFAFGLFTRRRVNDRLTPAIALFSPLITFVLDHYSKQLFNGYVFGFEVLVLNGLITFMLLLLFSHRQKAGDSVQDVQKG